MDSTTIRIAAGAIAVLVLIVIVWRRSRQASH